MFKGRNLVIATKHEKERVIAPVLELELGVTCFTTSTLNTDEWGTFSGEVERKDDPIMTARKKCFRAMDLTNCDLAVASEGSFGPHPSLYFVPADDEFLLFIDRKNNLEIVVRELSTETNFNGAEVLSDLQLNDFARKANFPSHGLIMRKSKKDFQDIVKGITIPEQLYLNFGNFLVNFGGAYIETDMRAMYNPTRMKVIGNAAVNLANKINNLCSSCGTPGFGITDAKRGLLCELCNLPTNNVKSHFYTCQKCFYTEEIKFPIGKVAEDPMYCNFCNP